MGWQERIVYFRDFAYAHPPRRTRMASGTVGDVPAATYAELLSGRMIDIYVGQARRHWALHRNLLCHHSERLESDLQGQGSKRQDTLELPDHDPAGFELLVKWLYQGKLDDVSDFADANQKYDYAVSCHKLYLLCDRFDMPQLKNVAMDQYRKGLNQAELVPDAEEIDEIYRNSPQGSPFRRLMTRIAARQIMDPDSDRDVETYRQCFEDNPDFAVDLVKAMKYGTGGMLFDDPTDTGNECDYHDHDDGPNCHVKGKGKGKQALKTNSLRRDPRFASSDPSTKSVQTLLPPHRHRPPPILQAPPPRHARRQSETTSAGPLRRRLTSPASSTIETSTQHATARPPSPKAERDKFRRVTPPEAHLPSPPLTEETQSHPVHEDLPPSSDGGSRPHQASNTSGESDKDENVKLEHTSPAKGGIWHWARAGTRLNMLGRLPHPPSMTLKAATTAVNGALGGGKVEVKDDFSIPSATSTEPHNDDLVKETAAAKMEGLGLANSTVEQRSLFSQTKRSSDELVASITGTPSPQASESRHGEHDTPNGLPNEPITPSPASRKSQPNGAMSENTPSPHRIPKYKIALASNILSSARIAST